MNSKNKKCFHYFEHYVKQTEEKSTNVSMEDRLKIIGTDKFVG